MTENTPFQAYLDLFFQYLREAGFEDGIDFNFEVGPESYSDALFSFIHDNSHDINQWIDVHMQKRGYKRTKPRPELRKEFEEEVVAWLGQDEVDRLRAHHNERKKRLGYVLEEDS